VALAAWRAKALTLGGALAAILVGTLVLLGTGWPGGLVLGVFFVGSSMISEVTQKTQRTQRTSSASFPDPKSNRRDSLQVAANGGPTALAALLGLTDPPLALWIVTASLAAAAADTWATSIGTLSRTPPRLLVSGRVVAPGTSGGVTPVGTLGGLAGAALVAVTGALAGGGARLLLIGTLIGFAGMLVDSVLGGTLQGRFYCIRCGAPSEWRRHRCGEATVHKEGFVWLNNDAVNLAATSLAAVAGAAVWSSWAP
jgi:uncharacterized protein (TIGR00297 family)